MLNRAVTWITRKALESDAFWRYGLNLSSTLAYRRADHPQSKEVRRVVDALNRDGVAETTVDRLFADRKLYDELLRESGAMARERKAAGTREDAYTQDSNFLGGAPRFDPDSIFARFAVHDEILAIVNSYFGMYTQLRKYAVFLNEAQQGGPTVNQRYHRDGDYHYLLIRLFVYLADVTGKSGPFTYYPNTHVKGTIDRRAKLKDVAAIAEPRPMVGPAGTLVFADTRGFHKGGLCEEGSRFFYNALYTSPAVGADYFTRSRRIAPKPRTDAASWALSAPHRLF